MSIEELSAQGRAHYTALRSLQPLEQQPDELLQGLLATGVDRRLLMANVLVDPLIDKERLEKERDFFPIVLDRESGYRTIWIPRLRENIAYIEGYLEEAGRVGDILTANYVAPWLGRIKKALGNLPLD